MGAPADSFTRQCEGSIGIAWTHGSWPVYDATGVETTRAFVRNPPFIDEPGRWVGIPEWKPRVLTGFWPWDFIVGIIESNKTISVPWHPDWKTPGGTQPGAADNGVIVTLPETGVWWEIQGMAPATNYRWRADALARLAPGVTPNGSQGPWAKLDGLLRASWLRGPWPGPVRLVCRDVQWGPLGTAVPGAKVEHPRPGQPYQGITLPVGNDPSLLPCGQKLKWVPRNENSIEQWLDDEKVPANSQLRVSKRWFAIGLRDQGMRLSESGTGARPMLESAGGVNPLERAEFIKCGVGDELTAMNLGRNIGKYGTWVEA
jgi:hypothetical protein